jgi:hypothetical protein
MIFKNFVIDGVFYEEESGILFNSIDRDRELSILNVNAE